MSEENPVDEVVEEIPTPDAPVPEHAPVPDPPAEEPPVSHDDMRPGFVDEILNKIDAVVEIVKGDPPPEIEPIIEPDETPAKRPWTHRNPFKR